ncbi:E3 ubiquitin-protein ligase RFWD3 [Morus notabilis]|uniref:E3 ubiquitin-protein ligase RFWD3 n=1 Tax=Morus notabilis TaxID=981085 RepID=W9QF11_9ROSA|nr:E3 ubiquitin-protein ligase RFWD3 [Morus notabilis]
MADHSPSGTELPQNQNEELNEAAPISLDNEVENEDDEEEEDEDDEDEEYMSEDDLIDELDSEEDAEEDEEDEEEEEGEGEGEACFLGDEGSEGNQWSASEIDGLFCPICMEPWTNDGDHHICCLSCGHIFGISCIQKWLKKCQNQGKCPQCNRRCKLKDVRKLFAARVVAIDEEAQKRIQSLENKCASLENERACWSKKEAEWRKLEAKFQLEVQQLKEISEKSEQQTKQKAERGYQLLHQKAQQIEQKLQQLEQKLAEDTKTWVEHTKKCVENQQEYASDLIAKAGLIDSKIAPSPLEQNVRLSPSDDTLLTDLTLYRILVGSLVNLTVTRPDIAYVVHLVNWAGNPTDRCSTTCYCFLLGSSLISWRSKKQIVVSAPTPKLNIKLLQMQHPNYYGYDGSFKTWVFLIVQALPFIVTIKMLFK